jgi:hypothetical protein
MHAFSANLLFAVIFLGGWSGPGATEFPLLGFVYLFLKTGLLYVPSLILRATVPRVRIDQMMGFNWKFLVPVAIINVIVIAFLLQVTKALGIAPVPGETDFLANLPQAIILFVGNLVVLAAAVEFIRRFGRQARLEASAASIAATETRDVPQTAH